MTDSISGRDQEAPPPRPDAASTYPDGPVEYILRRPVTITVVVAGRDPEQTVIDRVTVREPTGEDLFVTDRAQGEAEKAARLVAQLCDQPYQFARKLSGWDFTRLGEIVARFFPTEG